jgi:hypothetical protein
MRAAPGAIPGKEVKIDPPNDRFRALATADSRLEAAGNEQRFATVFGVDAAGRRRRAPGQCTIVPLSGQRGS